MKSISLVVVVLSLLLASPIVAQAPINSDVALQPAKGILVVRQQFRYTEANLEPDASTELDLRTVNSATTLVYAVTEKLTLLANGPYVLHHEVDNTSTGASHADNGLGDITLLAKIRLFRDDAGPLRTTRVGLITGAQLPTGQAGFSRDSVNPMIGGVFTHVDGRHAFSTDVLATIRTGSRANNELIRADASYSYRLLPERYGSTEFAALFGVLELNGLYETNGDREVFLSPGLQYVTTRWVLEATVQLPIAQNLDHRAERDFVIGVGMRFRF